MKVPNGRGELDKVSIFILTTLILMNRSIQAMTLKKKLVSANENLKG